MGADGGICYIGVKDAKAYEEVMRLAGWLIGNMCNEWAWGYKYPEPEFYVEPDGPETWKDYPNAVNLEGAYGTDCSYSLQDLFDFVRYGYAKTLVDGSVARNGTPIAEYTFSELQQSYLTHPRSPDYATGVCVHEWWADRDIKFIVDCIDDVPDSIKEMTLGEWTTRVDSLFIGFYREETWT